MSSLWGLFPLFWVAAICPERCREAPGAAGARAPCSACIQPP